MKLYSNVGIRTKVQTAADTKLMLHLLSHSLNIRNISLSLNLLSLLVYLNLNLFQKRYLTQES